MSNPSKRKLEEGECSLIMNKLRRDSSESPAWETLPSANLQQIFQNLTKKEVQKCLLVNQYWFEEANFYLKDKVILSLVKIKKVEDICRSKRYFQIIYTTKHSGCMDNFSCHYCEDEKRRIRNKWYDDDDDYDEDYGCSLFKICTHDFTCEDCCDNDASGKIRALKERNLKVNYPILDVIIYFDDYSFLKEVLNNIGKGIKTLTLGDNTKDKEISDIIDHLPGWFSTVENLIIDDFSNSNLIPYFKNFKSLAILMEELDSQEFKDLFNASPNLESLTCASSFEEDTMEYILASKNHVKLKSLEVCPYYNSHVPKEGKIYLSNLTHLTIKTENGLNLKWNYKYENLTHLELLRCLGRSYGSTNISDETVKSCIDCFPNMKSFCAEDVSIDPQTFVYMSVKWTHLRSLNLNFLYEFTFQLPNEVVEFRSLNELILEGEQYDTKSMQHFFKLPNLKILQFDFRFPDEEIEPIMKILSESCPNVEIFYEGFQNDEIDLKKFVKFKHLKFCLSCYSLKKRRLLMGF